MERSDFMVSCKKSNEKNNKRFRVYSQELFKDVGNQIIVNQKLWECFLSDYEMQEEAIKVVKNKWDVDSFQDLNIINQMLLDYEKISVIIYFKLVNLILSNKDLARCRISRNSNTFLETVLHKYDTDLDYSKNFILEEIELGYHNHTIYDLRYLLLRNESFDEDEKKNLIEEYDQDEYDTLVDTIQWDIVNNSLKNGKPSVSIDEILFENIDIVELYLNNEDLLNDVRFVRKLVNIRKPSWLNQKVKKKNN